MLVSKWGNSLAVRLPKALVEELGLKEGDELNVVAASDGAITGTAMKIIIASETTLAMRRPA